MSQAFRAGPSRESITEGTRFYRRRTAVQALQVPLHKAIAFPVASRFRGMWSGFYATYFPELQGA